MATTRINVGSVESVAGIQTVGPNLVLALSDSSAATGAVLAPGLTGRMRLRLNQADIDAIPDGLVGRVRAVAKVQFERNYNISLTESQATGQPRYALPGQVLFVEVDLSGTSLTYFRGYEARLTYPGPWATGVSLLTLKNGTLDVVMDTTRLFHQASIESLYLEVESNELPVITPGGFFGSGDRPVINFGFRDPDGYGMAALRMHLFTEEQAKQPGFNPNTATPEQYSGTVYTASPSYSFPDPVQTNVAYRAYIQATEEGANNRFTEMTAAGPYVGFVVVADPGPVPIVTAERKSSPQRVALEVSAPFNLLTESESKLETATANSPTSRYFTQRARNQSLSRTARTVYTTTTTAEIDVGGPWVTVTPGRKYSAAIRTRVWDTGAATAMAKARLRFFNDADEIVATVDGPDIRVNATVSVPLHVTNVVAPEGATWALLYGIVTTAANREYGFDSAQIVEDETLNLLGNPLLDRDTDGNGVVELWNKTSSPGNPLTVSLSFGPSLVAGDRSTVCSVGANSGWQGVFEYLDLAPNATYGVVAVAMLSKAGNIRIDPYQGPLTTVAVQANEPVVLSANFNALPQNPTGAPGHVAIVTDAANCDLTIGFVQLLPVSLGYDLLTSVRFSDWTPGEGAATTKPKYRVERSIDNGNTWQSVRTGFASIADDGRRTLSVDDYEAPDDTVLYRARSVRSIEDAASSQVPSSASIATLAAGTITANTDSWLISLRDPDLRTTVEIKPGYQTSRSKNASVKRPLKGKPVVHYGTAGSWSGVLGLQLISNDEYEALSALDELRETLLLSEWNGRRLFVDLYEAFAPEQIADHVWQIDVPYIETEPPEDED